MEVDDAALRALNIDPASWVSRENSKIQFFLHHKVVMLYICIYILALQLAGKAVNVVADVIKTTYEKAKECLETNYYGVKDVTEALLPLLQLSTSGARIVNVSSLRSELRVNKKKDKKLLF